MKMMRLPVLLFAFIAFGIESVPGNAAVANSSEMRVLDGFLGEWNVDEIHLPGAWGPFGPGIGIEINEEISQ